MEEMAQNNDFSFLNSVEKVFSYDKYNLETEKEFTLFLQCYHF